MNYKHTLTSIVLSLLLSGVASAAGSPPDNVKNVQGFIADGKLTVTWDTPIDAQSVASYRIYYSHQSILGNDGNYDDFEQTPDNMTTYTFDSLPLSSPVIFIGVLAVNKEDTESEGFEVESSVPIPADLAVPIEPQASSLSSTPLSSSSSSAAALSSASVSPPPLLITSVEAESETGVLLKFNKPIQEATSLMPRHFQITDTGGTLLPVFSVLRPDASHAILVTAPQRPDTTYVLRVTTPVNASDGGTTSPDLHIEFRSKQAPVVAEPVVTAPLLPEALPAKDYGKNPALLIPRPTETTVVSHIPVSDASRLPDSGVGLMVGVLIAAGAATGRMMGRRKRGG